MSERREIMAVAVSKADALLEMVKAHESHQVKKANQIGQVLCKSIREDSSKKEYNAFVELDRNSKQLFPTKIRKNIEKVLKSKNVSEIEIEIEIEDGVYGIIIENDEIIIRKK